MSMEEAPSSPSAAVADAAASPKERPDGEEEEDEDEEEAVPFPRSMSPSLPSSPVVPRWHWSPENVRLARDWAARATLLRWRHYEAAVYYSRFDRWLGIPIFFLTNAMGTALVAAALETAGGSCSSPVDAAGAGGNGTDVASFSSSSSSSSCTAVVAVNWICAVASFLTAGLTGVLYYVDPSTVAQKHLEKAAAYDDIYRELELELSMAGPARQDPAHVLRHASARWSAVELRTPPLPARFRDKVPPPLPPLPVVSSVVPEQEEEEEEHRPRGGGRSRRGGGGDIVVVLDPPSSSSSAKRRRCPEAAAAATRGDDHVSHVEMSAAFQAHVDSFRTTARTDRIRYQLSRFETVHGGSGPPLPL